MSKTDSSIIQDIKPASLLNGSSILTDGMSNSKAGVEGEDQPLPVDEVRIKLATGIHEVSLQNFIL